MDELHTELVALKLVAISLEIFGITEVVHGLQSHEVAIETRGYLVYSAGLAINFALLSIEGTGLAYFLSAGAAQLLA